MAHVCCFNFFGKVDLYPAIPLVQSCTKPPKHRQINKPLTGSACYSLFPLHLHSFGKDKGILRCVYDKTLQRVNLTQPESITRSSCHFSCFCSTGRHSHPAFNTNLGTGSGSALSDFLSMEGLQSHTAQLRQKYN